MWLHELLGKDPELGVKLRIMTYGYDAQLQGPSSSTGSIMDIILNLLREVEKARKKVSQDPRVHNNKSYVDYLSYIRIHLVR